ncbi:MAG: glycosyltransferase family 9 protein [Bryobacteraceae bacterium]|jgi:ADP-heptose:LPS heptosyltransferase
MDSVVERLPERARVAVVRLRSLGDCVLTTPALALLKQTRPDLEIAIVAEDRFAPVFSHNPDVNRTLGPSPFALARWRPHLCLNLHGGPRSAQLTVASRAALRAGFERFRFRPVYNLRIPKPQPTLQIGRKAHTAEHIASAAFWLGAPLQEIPPARLFAEANSVTGTEFPRREAAGNKSPFAAEFRCPSPSWPHTVVLHPYASAPDNTWPAESFLALASHPGLGPVFIGAAADDMTPFRAHRCLQGASLEQVKTLLAGAALFMGNDSGPAHMAAAFGLPSLVFFGNSDIDQWRPWKTEAAVLADPAGIHAISLERAVEALEHLKVNA